MSLILSSSSQQAAGRAGDAFAASDWGNLSDEQQKAAEELLAKCYGYSYTNPQVSGNYYSAYPYTSYYPTATGNLYSGYPVNIGYPVNSGYTFG